MAVMNRPKPTKHQNTIRQVAMDRTAPPATGAIMGARALTAMRIDMAADGPVTILIEAE